MHHAIEASHVNKGPAGVHRDSPVAPQWPSYTGNSQLVGISSSGMTTVYVDPTLGGPALQNAQDLLGDADRVAAANNAIFGTPGGPTSVGRSDGMGQVARTIWAATT